MSVWSSEQYLKFKEQRTQPALDLARRIAYINPRTILDIGCGPGNSTAVLNNIFPNADILGIDSSEDMIAKAKETYADMNFELCDITTDLDRLGKHDVIFSNACLQWVPNHKELIPKLMSKLNKGGVLAVQMPRNAEEPIMRIMDSVVKRQEWGFKCVETNETMSPEAYYDILSSCADNFDIWETVYHHIMPDVNAIAEWIKGTRLRPYLNQLSPDRAELLIREITEKAEPEYAPRADGRIIFKFRRLFFTAFNCVSARV